MRDLSNEEILHVSGGSGIVVSDIYIDRSGNEQWSYSYMTMGDDHRYHTVATLDGSFFSELMGGWAALP